MRAYTGYTDSEIHNIKNLREAGLSWKAIAKVYNTTVNSLESAVRRRDSRGNKNDTSASSAYKDGAIAHKENRPKLPPHSYMTNLWSWWLAGWNDRDRELLNDQNRFHRRPNATHGGSLSIKG